MLCAASVSFRPVSAFHTRRRQRRRSRTAQLYPRTSSSTALRGKGLPLARSDEGSTVVCSATREAVEGKPRSKASKQPRSQYRATLLSPPDSLPTKLRRLYEDPNGTVRRFVLISRDSRFCSSANSAMKPLKESFEISQSEQKKIEALKGTPFYRLLFSLCPEKFKDSQFYDEAAVLPCRVRRDGSWGVAWDIVELLNNSWSHEADLNTLLQSCLSGDRERRPPSDLIQSMQRIASTCPSEYPAVPKTATWSDVEAFLLKSAVVSPRESPIVGPSLDATRQMRSVSGYRIDVDTGEAVKVEHYGVKVDAELSPLPAAWLNSFLVLQRYLPSVHAKINAELLRIAIGFGAELPVEALSQRLSPHGPDFKKVVALGNAAIRLVFLLKGWQSSDGCRHHNSKAESTRSSEDVRNVVLGEKLSKFRTVSELLDEWGGSKMDKDLPSISDWYNALRGEGVEVQERGYSRDDAERGMMLKAFVGAAMETLSIRAAWKICEAVNLVKLQEGSCLEPYVRIWQNPRRRRGIVQSWEEPYTWSTCDIPDDQYDEFCSAFGYRFRQRHRFGWAMTHASHPTANSSIYFWLSFLGKAVLDVFFQQHVMKTHPELSQTEINRIFSDTPKLNMCFDLALDLNLHRISRMTNSTTVAYLTRYQDDREALREDNGTRNYISTLTLTLLGALAMDVAFHMPSMMKLMKPHFGRMMDNYSNFSDVLYITVNRYVPISLEASHFETSPIAQTQYYPTLMELSRDGSSVKCFSVYILTKVPLPEIPHTVMRHYTDAIDLRVRWKGFESLLEVSNEEQEHLKSLQDTWFEPILAPETRPIAAGPQCKRYLVAPAKSRDGTAADIDWELVQHIVHETLPEDISTLLSYFRRSSPDQKVLKKAARAVLKRNQMHSWQERKRRRDVLEAAGRQLVFLSDQRHVLHSTGGGMSPLLNQFCLLDMIPNGYTARSAARRVPLNTASAKCLPYTLSYFRCLSCLPVLLDAMERRLIAEDYRREYSLPKSIPLDQLLLAISVQAGNAFGRLEALGQSVLHYLRTLSIVRANHTESQVGDLSVVRSEIQNAREFASQEDTHFLMGHLQTISLFVDREWSPPGIPPFTLELIQPSESTAADEKASVGKPVEIQPVKGRVGSGYFQNICTGVPFKHLKCVAALCFLYGGIESACAYLNRTGAVNLDQCTVKPKRRSKSRMQKYRKLQEMLDYKFRDEKILAQAFMHSSAFSDPRDNNEILEFLGDAVLELCIYAYLQKAHPDLPVPETTELKIALTNNKLFGWLSASLELPYLLMHRIGGFYEGLDPSRRSKKQGIYMASVNKVASDVLEALVGAVLMDSGFSVKTVHNVVLTLLRDVLDDPDSFGIEIKNTE